MRAVTVQTLVSAGLHATYDAFVDRIDAWWVRAGPGTVELRADALVLRAPDGAERVLATVCRLERPHDVELLMDGERVVIQFRPVDAGRTRVCVVHERTVDLTAFQDPVGVRWSDRLAKLQRVVRALLGSPRS